MLIICLGAQKLFQWADAHDWVKLKLARIIVIWFFAFFDEDFLLFTTRISACRFTFKGADFIILLLNGG